MKMKVNRKFKIILTIICIVILLVCFVYTMFETMNREEISLPYGIFGLINGLCFAESVRILIRNRKLEMEHLEFLVLMMFIAISLVIVIYKTAV